MLPIVDGIVIGVVTGALISGTGGLIIALNSSGGKTDVNDGLIHGIAGGVIGGVLGDIVTGNSTVGIITGATIGTGCGLTLLILKELSTIG